MELAFDPRPPWHWVAFATAALGAALVLLALLPARRGVFGGVWPARIGGAALYLLALAALAMAATNPLLVRRREVERMHLAVVLDNSPSMQRAAGGWSAVRNATAQVIESGLTELPAPLRETGTASLVVFRDEAGEPRPGAIPLDDLPGRVRALPPDAIGGAGSNLAAGLREAGARVAAAEAQGAVLLVSDGLATDGDAAAAARELARRGIPVYVLAVPSEAAELAIIAADLPRQTLAGANTTLRGMLWNGRAMAASATLSVTLNSGLVGASPRVSTAGEATVPLTRPLDPQGTARIRTDLAFGGHGLQFADFTLSYDAGRGQQRRRLFTHVKRPIELLSIGGDRRWEGAFPEEGARITPIRPGDLATVGDLQAFDAIVIGAVPATDFAPGELAQLAAAVERDGLGLMLINGDHGGADQEAATVLKSYDDTPLAPLLPVISGPRPFEEEPPSRHVVFLIDASGSMEGWPLTKAQEIVAYIIEHELRPTDKVDIIAFNTAALHLVKGQATVPSAKPGIIQQLNSIQAGGGTDPTDALKLIEAQQFTECGLIFLSDGEFSAVNLRPDCRATAFSIGGGYPPALAQFADPFPVDPNFSPMGITIPYFEPEKRTRLWEPGSFTALSTAVLSRTMVQLPVPDLTLPGSAISHPKPEALLVAVRPKVKDPVLAYAERGAGFVGVMTSVVTEEWLADEAGAGAVEEWIRQVAPYAARDRYDLRLQDDGLRMTLRIAVVAEGDNVPDVSGMQITLEQPGQPPQAVPVEDDPTAPATFLADVRPVRGPAAGEATLVVRERGGDRLARPQRIPLVIPPAGAVTPPITTEAYSYGLNTELLTRIAETGGAEVLRPEAPIALLTPSPPGRDQRALWPWLALLGGALLLAAVALKRFAP